MPRFRFMVAAVLATSLPVVGLAGNSKAYVLVSDTPTGSITPLHPKNGALGPSFFVPSGGTIIVIAPHSREVWEIIVQPLGPASIAVLNPETGDTLATIPLTVSYPQSITFDAGGKYAYVTDPSGYIIKIDVAMRKIVLQAASPAYSVFNYQVAFSSDGSRLFIGYAAYPTGVVVVFDPVTLKPLSSLPLPSSLNSILITGRTLLVTVSNELLYFDAISLEQTNAVAIPPYNVLFGVSPDGSKVYLYTYYSSSSMEILDFASGDTLVAKNFQNGALGNVLLSPDGKQVVVASNPALLVDARTLDLIGTVQPMGGPVSAAYRDPDTVLLLNFTYYNSGSAIAVIDQSTALITATIPIALDNAEESIFADREFDAIWTGAYEAPSLSVVNARTDRVGKSFAVYGFAPAARSGNVVYGTDNSSGAFYDLATGLSGYLPPILPVGPNYFLQVLVGAAAPDGKAYWAPFYLNRLADGLDLPSSGIGIYATATNALASRISPPGYNAGPFVFDPRGGLVYIATTDGIAVYDTQTLDNKKMFSYTTSFTSLVISHDGATLYAADDGTAIYVLDASTGAARNVFAVTGSAPYYPGHMALSEDGMTLFLTDSSASCVYLVDTVGGQVRVVSVGAVGIFPAAIAMLPG